jgi:hypothetical protein
MDRGFSFSHRVYGRTNKRDVSSGLHADKPIYDLTDMDQDQGRRITRVQLNHRKLCAKARQVCLTETDCRDRCLSRNSNRSDIRPGGKTIGDLGLSGTKTANHGGERSSTLIKSRHRRPTVSRVCARCEHSSHELRSARSLVFYSSCMHGWRSAADTE